MADVGEQLEQSPFWLVHALTWPARVDKWSLARTALVWVPELAGALPRAAQDVRHVAETYHQHYGGSVVFFSDLDVFLEEEGTSWRERRTDTGAAVDQLLNGDLAVPGMLLLISWYAHGVLARNPRTPPTLDAREAWQREAVRQAIGLQLAVDWPVHMRHVTDTVRRTSPPSIALFDDRDSGQRGA